MFSPPVYNDDFLILFEAVNTKSSYIWVLIEIFSTKWIHPLNYFLRAITSISISTSFGKRATSTQERAG